MRRSARKREIKRGGEAVFVADFSPAGELLFGAVAQQVGSNLTCSGRNEKSREPAHVCRGIDKSQRLRDRCGSGRSKARRTEAHWAKLRGMMFSDPTIVMDGQTPGLSSGVSMAASS